MTFCNIHEKLILARINLRCQRFNGIRMSFSVAFTLMRVVGCGYRIKSIAKYANKKIVLLKI